MSTTTSYTTCHLCEAVCGLEVEHDDERIHSIRGDAADVHSRGYVCPKATGIADVQLDPDRIRQPLKKRADGTWEPIGWEEAIELAVSKLAAIQAEHGNDAVAYYQGNPTGHSSSAILYAILFTKVLASKNLYSAQSVDALPRVLASYLMYGNQGLISVPDLDRTDMLLILGANPVVSNGSVMSSPFIKKRLKAIRERGGKIVVLDPRRTETAALADQHVAIVPGTDALLLAALIHTVFDRGLTRHNHVTAVTDGLEALERAVRPFTPARVAPVCGIDAAVIIQLAIDFASSPSAVCYGRMGTCTQPHGTLATCLIDALNIVTGNFDRNGGAMFATPAIDLAGVAALLGQRGDYARWHSRVSALPEFNGELPVAALTEEIDTAGPRQIRGLVLHAGNPVLSIPDGRGLDASLAKLDFVVAIDIYLNETTRHADLILPSTFGLEHDHYPLIALGLALRNVTKTAPAVMPHPPGVRHDWEIFLALARGILARRGVGSRVAAAMLDKLASRGPRAILALAVRVGPHGIRGRGLTLEAIEEATHGIDLGPLEPRLPAALQTKTKRIELLPRPIARDLPRLERELLPADGPRRLTLISRRHLRSNNSWMHNSQRLLKGPARCTVMMHPDDARTRNVESGTKVTLRTDVGSIDVDAVVSDEMMPGVISLPHGWGHDRAGAQLGVAAKSPGASINDITAAHAVDPVSGCSSFAIHADVQPARG